MHSNIHAISRLHPHLIMKFLLPIHPFCLTHHTYKARSKFNASLIKYYKFSLILITIARNYYLPLLTFFQSCLHLWKTLLNVHSSHYTSHEGYISHSAQHQASVFQSFREPTLGEILTEQRQLSLA